MFFRNVGEFTLYGVTFQKTALFVVTALGSSGLTNIRIVEACGLLRQELEPAVTEIRYLRM